MTGQSRDVGLTGAGKGSRPRNCGSKAFNQNYDEIEFHNPLVAAEDLETIYGFKRKGNKLQKVYK